MQADSFQPVVKMTAVFGNFVEFSVKRGAVIVHPGMDEFMQHDVIPEFFRQQYQLNIQADAMFGTAATPPRSLITDRYTVKTKSVLLGKLAKPHG